MVNQSLPQQQKTASTKRVLDALRRHVLEAAETADLFGGRVYPVISPTTATRPYAVYRRHSIQREQSFSGPIGHPKVFVDFSIYADTYEEAVDTADAVRRSLDGESGVVGGVFIQSVWLEDESDDYVQLAGSEMPPLYSVSMTFGVIWKEI